MLLNLAVQWSYLPSFVGHCIGWLRIHGRNISTYSSHKAGRWSADFLECRNHAVGPFCLLIEKLEIPRARNIDPLLCVFTHLLVRELLSGRFTCNAKFFVNLLWAVAERLQPMTCACALLGCALSFVGRSRRRAQLLAACLFRLVPESLVWLVSAGKLRTAEVILERAARVNGCPNALPPHCLVNDHEVEGTPAAIPVASTSTYTVAANRSAYQRKAPLTESAEFDLADLGGNSSSLSDELNRQVERETSADEFKTTADSLPHLSKDALGSSTAAICSSDAAEVQSKHTVLDLFRTPVIRRYTLSMFVIWLVRTHRSMSASYVGNAGVRCL